MTITDILLLGLVLLAIVNTIQAHVEHRQRLDQADVAYSLIVDFLEVIKERLNNG